MEGNDKAEMLREAIKNKVENVMVIQKSNDITLQITNIDADVDEAQLKTEIAQCNKNIGGDIRIISLREMRNGNQMATIKINKKEGEKLEKRGRIKIGWSFCKIWKKVRINRCFRCLEYGHRTVDCRGEDRSETCINCGQSGHKAKMCSNHPRCTTCNKEGHRADQRKCPAFKKLMDDEEKKRRVRNRNQGRRDTYMSRLDPDDQVFAD